MKVVNFFAAPGGGKTATAQTLAGLLAIKGYKVEYVPEHARLANYEDNSSILSDQILILALQHHYFHLYETQGLDFVISDSPLPTGLLYTPTDYFKAYEPLVWELFNAYNNKNYYLPQVSNTAHHMNGRAQTKEQSLELDLKLKNILKAKNVQYSAKNLYPKLPFEIFEELTGYKFEE